MSTFYSPQVYIKACSANVGSLCSLSLSLSLYALLCSALRDGNIPQGRQSIVHWRPLARRLYPGSDCLFL